jgi:hypothetical protein
MQSVQAYIPPDAMPSEGQQAEPGRPDNKLPCQHGGPAKIFRAVLKAMPTSLITESTKMGVICGPRARILGGFNEGRLAAAVPVAAVPVGSRHSHPSLHLHATSCAGVLSPRASLYPP